MDLRYSQFRLIRVSSSLPISLVEFLSVVLTYCLTPSVPVPAVCYLASPLFISIVRSSVVHQYTESVHVGHVVVSSISHEILPVNA